MRFLVCSDSHGRYERLIDIVRRHPDVADMLFLGDGLADLSHLRERFPQLRIRAVRGNCDGLTLLSRETPTVDRFTLFGHGVLLAHGDQFAVKRDLREAELHAAQNGCHLLLYGHTHTAEEHYLSAHELYVMNPGSVGRSADGRTHYGFADILPQGIVTTLCSL